MLVVLWLNPMEKPVLLFVSKGSCSMQMAGELPWMEGGATFADALNG